MDYSKSEVEVLLQIFEKKNAIFLTMSVSGVLKVQLIPYFLYPCTLTSTSWFVVQDSLKIVILFHYVHLINYQTTFNPT